MYINNKFYGSLGSSYFSRGISGLQSNAYSQLMNAQKTVSAGNYTYANRQSTVNTNALNYVKGLKSNAADLKGAVSALTNGSAFRQTAITSSDTKALEIKSTGPGRINAQDMQVEISQVASGQVNQGQELAQNAKAGLSGYQQFAIEANGKSYQFSVNISAGDSNQAVQQKMADAINKRDIGITANVDVDNKEKTSSLRLQAQGTGDSDANRFSIRDVAGEMVSKTGAATVTQDAQNAVYSVNSGPERTSQSNEVYLGGGVSGTLKQTTDEALSVSAQLDLGQIMEHVTEMISSFNALVDTARSNADIGNASTLERKLSSAAGNYASSLSAIGVTMGSDGYMSMDKDKLTGAIQSGAAKDFFTQGGGMSYGFGSRMSQLADDVTNNTAKYAGNVSASYPSNNQYYNIIQTARTNSLLNMGMLFDMWM